MAEGKQIGKVDDLVVDPERKAVSWLRLHSGGMGMLGGERLWVSVEAVHGVGEDAVTINEEATLELPPTRPKPSLSSTPSAGSSAIRWSLRTGSAWVRYVITNSTRILSP